MIVITTPTGRIGSKVIPHLLKAGETVRVVARDPSKLAPAWRGQVQIVTGSMDDEAVLNQALEAAESVFLVVPSSFHDNNDTEYYLRFTRPMMKAMREQGVKRVVDVSVLGRGTRVAERAGPITASLNKDKEIESNGVDYQALWCPALMENMLGSIESIKKQGAFFSCMAADVKAPQVATKDVAAMAAELLIERIWTGQGGRAVLGPEDLSYNDLANVMSDVLGTTVRYLQLPAEAFKTQLMQHGANEIFAQGIVDMLIAKSNGMDNLEPRTAENTTPTSFRQWSEEVLNQLFSANCQDRACLVDQ